MLAAGGGLIVAVLTRVAWFERTTSERGTGETIVPPTDLSLWDLREPAAIAVVAIGAAVVLLSVLRVGPWLVGGAGIALIAVLAWSALDLLGTGTPACCETIRTETSPLIPFLAAGIAAVTVVVGGMWAAESD